MTTPFLDALRQNRLLRGCPEDVLAKIEGLVTRIERPAQSVLFRVGDPGDTMYLVLDGSVKLSTSNPPKGEETQAVVTAGEFFGDMALLDHDPHVVQATTLGDAVLGCIDSAGIEEILRGERLYHVGTMTGSIIHDFKNPLTAIRCACDLLEARDHDETHRRLAEIIKQSVERMMGMTQELLDYTLGGNAPLKFEPFSIDGLIAGLDVQCLGDLPRRGIVVERLIDFHGIVRVDVQRFERALLNIIKNAREAMPRGGRLRLAVWLREPWVVFEIEDNGRGMTPEVAAMIFEPFFTHGKPEGTGLGMPMARSVVDAHGGTIQVQSQPGQGTRFEVQIPLDGPPRT